MVLNIYSDAHVRNNKSSKPRHLLGLYSYYIPSLAIQYTSQILEGMHSTDLEFLGALEGLKSAAKKRPFAPLVLNTDCQTVQMWIKEIKLRLAGKTRRCGMRLTKDGAAFRYPELILEMSSLIKNHQMSCVLVHSDTNEHHLFCHNLAGNAMKALMTDELKKKVCSQYDLIQAKRALKIQEAILCEKEEALKQDVERGIDNVQLKTAIQKRLVKLDGLRQWIAENNI